MPNKKRVFFLKNGRELKNSIADCFIRQNESITSLFDSTAISSVISKSSQIIKPGILFKLGKELSKSKNVLSSLTRNYKPAHIWAFSSFFMFTAATLIFLLLPWKVKPLQQDKYSIYASTPLTLKDMSYSIYTRDSRAQKINAVFKEYKCPLEGLGEVFVYEADKYNIPWWLVAAVSFQESTCGKRTPEPSGLESYNAWGWAVYGDNVQTFDNWVRGIETVSEYMSENFYQKGVTEPCEIMKTYTPPSKGSWCEGVMNFGDQIQNYSTSEESEIVSL
ncbi:hypothetical protein GYA27_04555 [candidate division WWE3 bacterium]|uniref:Mannosyl-glycoprotein endo-beta-N-acetylglucosamidase-like domain-containing protein n=1 Tax=candidate division WWE3 bacterium TaxID=2053526 RepID=A0A7X9DLI7_UNCKA|nr:hypothetical protein [candidate division WWE3 bacterium]